MQKIFLIENINEYEKIIDPEDIEYLKQRQVETYEGYDDCEFLAIDYYDIHDPKADFCKIVIYLDSDNAFFVCYDQPALAAAKSLYEQGLSNSESVYGFLGNMIKGNFRYLETLDDQIADLDMDVADGTQEGLREKLTAIKNQVNKLTKYYIGLEFLLDEICNGEHLFIEKKDIPDFKALHNRTIRLVSLIRSINEHANIVWDNYQSQVGIEQNELMKVFTFVTSIFLPLTLIAGWYGMNLKMPEFGWRYGYVYVIVLCAVVSAIWYWYFKKRNLFK